MPLRSPVTGVNVSSVQAFIDDDTFNYFFSRDTPSVLGHTIGARQMLIAQFFEKLHAACVAEGIAPRWEPDGEDRVQKLMNKLNFDNKADPNVVIHSNND